MMQSEPYTYIACKLDWVRFAFLTLAHACSKQVFLCKSVAVETQRQCEITICRNTQEVVTFKKFSRHRPQDHWRRKPAIETEWTVRSKFLQPSIFTTLALERMDVLHNVSFNAA